MSELDKLDAFFAGLETEGLVPPLPPKIGEVAVEGSEGTELPEPEGVVGLESVVDPYTGAVSTRPRLSQGEIVD